MGHDGLYRVPKNPPYSFFSMCRGDILGGPVGSDGYCVDLGGLYIHTHTQKSLSIFSILYTIFFSGLSCIVIGIGNTCVWFIFIGYSRNVASWERRTGEGERNQWKCFQFRTSHGYLTAFLLFSSKGGNELVKNKNKKDFLNQRRATTLSCLVEREREREKAVSL